MKKNWEASLVHELFISIQFVRIFSSVLQEAEVKLESKIEKVPRNRPFR